MGYIFVVSLFQARKINFCYATRATFPHQHHFVITRSATNVVVLSIPASTVQITYLCNSGFCHKRCTTVSSKCSSGQQSQWCSCYNIVIYGRGDVYVLYVLYVLYA
jgi:hypothetical protein